MTLCQFVDSRLHKPAASYVLLEYLGLEYRLQAMKMPLQRQLSANSNMPANHVYDPSVLELDDRSHSSCLRWYYILQRQPGPEEPCPDFRSVSKTNVCCFRPLSSGVVCCVIPDIQNRFYYLEIRCYYNENVRHVALALGHGGRQVLNGLRSMFVKAKRTTGKSPERLKSVRRLSVSS